MTNIRLPLISAAVILTVFFSILSLLDPAFLREKIEAKTYDMRLLIKKHLKQEHTSENIIIVYIDEKSLKDIGRWPWKRNVMATLIKNIAQDKPKVIGIDVLFSERETATTDTDLSYAIKDAGNVVLASAFIVSDDQKGKAQNIDVPDYLWDSAFMNVKSVEGIKWKQWTAKAEKAILPIPQIAQYASLGHVYSHVDMDGALRWGTLYLQYGDDCYPHFALQIARIALGIPMKDMILYGGSSITLGNKRIPTDINGKVLINYKDSQLYRQVSASDILLKRIERGFFKDKIIIIGTSALATYDHKTTPLSGNVTGVSVNASIIENIMYNFFLKKSHGSIEMFVIALSGIVFGIFSTRLKAAHSAMMFAFVVAIYLAAAVYLLMEINLWVNITYPIANLSFIFISQTVIRFVTEEKKAKDIRSLFSRYVSPGVVETIIANPEKANLGGELKEVTVLFSDIVGFTSLSEKLPPEQVVIKLNEYFTDIVDIIFQFNGTINKFIGDAIMAYWNAPINQPNHAEMAVQCALAMVKKTEELQKKWMQQNETIIDIGVGINTGEVIVGNIGAEGKQMDYTIIGDHVNLGSRIEGLTRKYDTHILISEYTLEKIRHLIENGTLNNLNIRETDTVTVKGRTKPIKIYSVS